MTTNYALLGYLANNTSELTPDTFLGYVARDDASGGYPYETEPSNPVFHRGINFPENILECAIKGSIGELFNKQYRNKTGSSKHSQCSVILVLVMYDYTDPIKPIVKILRKVGVSFGTIESYKTRSETYYTAAEIPIS